MGVDIFLSLREYEERERERAKNRRVNSAVTCAGGSRNIWLGLLIFAFRTKELKNGIDERELNARLFSLAAS